MPFAVTVITIGMLPLIITLFVGTIAESQHGISKFELLAVITGARNKGSWIPNDLNQPTKFRDVFGGIFESIVIFCPAPPIIKINER